VLDKFARTKTPIITRLLFAIRTALELLAALLIVACASATITPEKVAQPANLVRPTRIVVCDFAVSPTEVTLNQSIVHRTFRAVQSNEATDKSRLEAAHAVAHDLADALVKDLQDLGFAVEKLPRGTPVSGNVLIVDGQFLNVDEGNRLRRVVIGFGAGASKLDTRVQVYQVSGGTPRRVLEFETQVESAKMPGAAVTMGAGAVATGAVSAGSAAAAAGMAGVKAHQSRMGALTDKTAEEITAYLSQYLAKQGWISSDKVRIPKFATPAQSDPSFPD
jgi:hypothetical protein